MPHVRLLPYLYGYRADARLAYTQAAVENPTNHYVSTPGPTIPTPPGVYFRDDPQAL